MKGVEFLLESEQTTLIDDELVPENISAIVSSQGVSFLLVKRFNSAFNDEVQTLRHQTSDNHN
jgi:hypothetical protein